MIGTACVIALGVAWCWLAGGRAVRRRLAGRRLGKLALPPPGPTPPMCTHPQLAIVDDGRRVCVGCDATVEHAPPLSSDGLTWHDDVVGRPPPPWACDVPDPGPPGERLG